MRSRKENVAKDNLPTSSSLPPYGSKNRVAGKSSRRQVILGCINPSEPPCKAATVRQQLKQEGEFCVVKIKKKDWMKWKSRPVSLNRIEGARGGDGMPGIFGKYLAIFYALCTAEAAVTPLLSGSNFEVCTQLRKVMKNPFIPFFVIESSGISKLTTHEVVINYYIYLKRFCLPPNQYF
ncbi:hypothetical protein OIU79_030528 [Salix purpurea]|uniref:Uncharacterized protein n=1 Tax=Salix purpurea TaxID=77065 RepID=A0A9Q0ZRJ8_SALPP|nr:hypothetical protein OIU79_030528 [Salix purpurea]